MILAETPGWCFDEENDSKHLHIPSDIQYQEYTSSALFRDHLHYWKFCKDQPKIVLTI